MRLLNVHTLEFREFLDDDDRPPYVITSHRWVGQEITYQQFLRRDEDSSIQDSDSYQKVLSFCQHVRNWMEAAENVQMSGLSGLGTEHNSNRGARFMPVSSASRTSIRTPREIMEHRDGREGMYRQEEETFGNGQHHAPRLSWIWIDTCCINKDSSHELSEAINSMFRWVSKW